MDAFRLQHAINLAAKQYELGEEEVKLFGRVGPYWVIRTTAAAPEAEEEEAEDENGENDDEEEADNQEEENQNNEEQEEDDDELRDLKAQMEECK